MSYLIDTNAISELVRKNPSNQVLSWFESTPNELLHLSVITLGEIRKGIEKLENGNRKQKLLVWLEHDLPDWFENRVITIDSAIADRWGRLQTQAKRPIPVIDSFLAATALHHDMCFVTRNVDDFNYANLEVINPWGSK